MKRVTSNRLLIGMSAVVVVAMIGYLVFGFADLPVIHMSGHGWFALALGVAFSTLLGIVLSTVFIIGRRRGFDESAHEAVIDVDPEN